MTAYDWIFGLGLTFGIPIIFWLITKGPIFEYLVYCTFVSIIMVQSGMFEIWVMILLFITDFIVLFYQMKSNQGGAPPP